VAVRELVARSVPEPAAVMRGLGEPTPGGIDILHRSPGLTILNLIWPANMIVMPHDHRMWSVIGIYDGREDNILWRRLPDRTDGRIEAAGARSISTGETVAFGADIIHSVVNPIARATGALHVYGGDLLGIERSEWDPDSLAGRTVPSLLRSDPHQSESDAEPSASPAVRPPVPVAFAGGACISHPLVDRVPPRSER
jgi:predicted metal-dependent enzyme (double-stranded beta helix superfamily)